MLDNLKVYCLIVIVFVIKLIYKTEQITDSDYFRIALTKQASRRFRRRFELAWSRDGFIGNRTVHRRDGSPTVFRDVSPTVIAYTKK